MSEEEEEDTIAEQPMKELKEVKIKNDVANKEEFASLEEKSFTRASPRQSPNKNDDKGRSYVIKL